MDCQDRKGFTLIELLAVIVILAIIALIATPIIVGVINKSKKNAFMDTAYGVVEAGKLYYAKNFGNDDFAGKTFVFPADSDELKLAGEKPGGGSLEVTDNGKQVLAIYDKGKNWCASKGAEDSKVTVEKYEEGKCGTESSETGYKAPELKGADPALGEGMIPVTIGTDGTVKKADTSSKWYDYENKQWANAVLVSSDVRNTYNNGDSIPEEKILGYFVWIPRYKYKLFNTDNKGVPEQEIEVVFESKGTSKSNGSTNGTYLTHPAFTFGSKELDGFWVGKFETTGSISSACINENCTTANLTVKPNITSVRDQTVSSMFYATRSMSTVSNNVYGLKSSEVNTHMMKNMEWGATAYLTQSKYGKCTDGTCSEVTINANSSYLTGAGNYKTNTNQSTTGNITGIYDMSGGAWEYVMGNMKDTSGNFYVSNAGFNGASDPKNPDSMYYDSYENDSSYTSHGRGLLGDATRETLKTFGSNTGGWYSDYAYFPNSTYSWFIRGGGYGNGPGAGVFYFSRGNGIAGSNRSWRLVVHK